jgi:hypothetical protein
MVSVAQTNDHVRRLIVVVVVVCSTLHLTTADIVLLFTPPSASHACLVHTQPRQQLDAGKRSEVTDMLLLLLLLDRPVAVDSSWAPACFFNPVFSAPHSQAKLLLQPPDAAPVSLQATSV